MTMKGKEERLETITKVEIILYLYKKFLRLNKGQNSYEICWNYYQPDGINYLLYTLEIIFTRFGS